MKMDIHMDYFKYNPYDELYNRTEIIINNDSKYIIFTTIPYYYAKNIYKI